MKKLLLCAAFIAASFTSIAQVGVDTELPMATLDVVGNAANTAVADGIIAPRITRTQLINKGDATYGPDQEGTIIYVTDISGSADTGKTINVTAVGYYYFDGDQKWQSLEAKGSGTGNGTNTAGSAGIGNAYGEVASATGKVWLDRNLGATQVAESSTDNLSYGDLYQWGRAADGHQVIGRASGTVTSENYGTQAATTWIADEGTNDWDAKFIIITAASWLEPDATNDNLWTGTAAENNPCPSGFRVPTNAELVQERLSWGTDKAAGAFNSPLKLPLAGYRNKDDDELVDVGSWGYYWSSTPYLSDRSRAMAFETNASRNFVRFDALGFSVRCIKD
jgi:uncharacterized protein (TIGR02145 family)